MISKLARKAMRPVVTATKRRSEKAAATVTQAVRRSDPSSVIDKLVASLCPKKLTKEIDRILHPDTALEVALATHKRGLRAGTAQALEKGMSLAGTLQGRDTIAKASSVLGFPEVGARHVKGLDKLLVGREAEQQAQAYARRLATIDGPAEMLKLWRSTPGALDPRTTLTQDIKSAAGQAFSGEFALLGPIHIPSWAGESIYKHLGVFNRLAG